jgi:hypothetical protein
MTNEQYLIVSYFGVAILSLAIGFGGYLWLKEPFQSVGKALPWKALRRLLARIFPLGVLLPALMGFLTVRYVGCEAKDYEHVIAQRSYLVDKSQEQVSASLTYVIWAVFGWCVLLAILLAVKRRFDRRNITSSANSGEEV